MAIITGAFILDTIAIIAIVAGIVLISTAVYERCTAMLVSDSNPFRIGIGCVMIVSSIIYILVSFMPTNTNTEIVCNKESYLATAQDYYEEILKIQAEQIKKEEEDSTKIELNSIEDLKKTLDLLDIESVIVHTEKGNKVEIKIKE